MGTIADKLYKLSAIKNSIRSALARKGKIADELFSSYSGLIDDLHIVNLSDPISPATGFTIDLSGSFGSGHGSASKTVIGSVTYDSNVKLYVITFNNNVQITAQTSGAPIYIRLSGRILLKTL